MDCRARPAVHTGDLNASEDQLHHAGRRRSRPVGRLLRGAGNNGPVSTAMASSFLNAAGTIGRVTISERIEAGRRERRVLTRVSRAAWRLEQAERERTRALASARAEGISIRTLAAAAGLSPSQVHQLVASADLDALDAALGELRAAGWSAPEDPDPGEDTELGGRDTIADRLSDEVSWLRQCADWLAHLDADSYPPTVSLRPAADWPDRAVVAVDLARTARSAACTTAATITSPRSPPCSTSAGPPSTAPLTGPPICPAPGRHPARARHRPVRPASDLCVGN
jgi:AcrR family transcriptional regulator